MRFNPKPYNILNKSRSLFKPFFSCSFREREEKLLARKKKNREDQEANYGDLGNKDRSLKESYEKIIKNIETNPNEYKGTKNVDRMRETILSKKHDIGEEI